MKIRRKLIANILFDVANRCIYKLGTFFVLTLFLGRLLLLGTHCLDCSVRYRSKLTYILLFRAVDQASSAPSCLIGPMIVDVRGVSGIP